MPNLAFALSKGIEAGANAGVGLIDTQLKEEAEERAANQKLQIEERLSAIKEAAAIRAEERADARKTEPMKRFSGLLGSKLDEQVQQEPEAVTRSTSEGARAAGLQDGLIGMTRGQVEAYNDPVMLAQYDKQIIEDKRIAKEKVAGKMRSRTQDEAIQAALDEALVKDPQAYAAGSELVKEKMKDKMEERKLQSREEIEKAKLNQKEDSDERKFKIMLERIEKIGNKSGGEKTALIQNAEYLRSLGFSDDKIEKFIFEKKEVPLEDIAAKILAGDSTLTPQEAAQKAIALRNSLQNSGKTEAPKPIVKLPNGAKQIGTSGGKPVYQTPDGKKFIAN